MWVPEGLLLSEGFIFLGKIVCHWQRCELWPYYGDKLTDLFPRCCEHTSHKIYLKLSAFIKTMTNIYMITSSSIMTSSWRNKFKYLNAIHITTLILCAYRPRDRLKTRCTSHHVNHWPRCHQNWCRHCVTIKLPTYLLLPARQDPTLYLSMIISQHGKVQSKC